MRKKYWKYTKILIWLSVDEVVFLLICFSVFSRFFYNQHIKVKKTPFILQIKLKIAQPSGYTKHIKLYP